MSLVTRPSPVESLHSSFDEDICTASTANQRHLFSLSIRRTNPVRLQHRSLSCNHRRHDVCFDLSTLDSILDDFIVPFPETFLDERWIRSNQVRLDRWKFFFGEIRFSLQDIREHSQRETSAEDLHSNGRSRNVGSSLVGR